MMDSYQGMGETYVPPKKSWVNLQNFIFQEFYEEFWQINSCFRETHKSISLTDIY